MIRLIATYFATALAVLALDIVWLTQFGPKVYFPILESVALPTARIGPAAVFYFLYIAGVLALAIWPTRLTRPASPDPTRRTRADGRRMLDRRRLTSLARPPRGDDTGPT
jgi:hypothetical protein